MIFVGCKKDMLHQNWNWNNSNSLESVTFVVVPHLEVIRPKSRKSKTLKNTQPTWSSFWVPMEREEGEALFLFLFLPAPPSSRSVAERLHTTHVWIKFNHPSIGNSQLGPLDKIVNIYLSLLVIWSQRKSFFLKRKRKRQQKQILNFFLGQWKEFEIANLGQNGRMITNITLHNVKEWKILSLSKTVMYNRQ